MKRVFFFFFNPSQGKLCIVLLLLETSPCNVYRFFFFPIMDWLAYLNKKKKIKKSGILENCVSADFDREQILTICMIGTAQSSYLDLSILKEKENVSFLLHFKHHFHVKRLILGSWTKHPNFSYFIKIKKKQPEYSL